MTVETSKIYEELAKVQSEIKDPARDKEVKQGKFSFKYAELSKILEIVRPILSKNNLCLIGSTEIRDSQVVLITKLVHTSGAEISSEYPVCSINNQHQQMGGALTYARRYNLSNLIGIAAVDDLDGDNTPPASNGERKRMSAHEARSEVNWDKIQDSIRTAASEKQIASIQKRVKERRDVWPRSYFTNAMEEIAKRRAELRDGNQITPTTEQPLSVKLDHCTQVEDVNRLHSLYEQLGYNMEDIADEFEAKIVEIEDKQREPV